MSELNQSYNQKAYIANYKFLQHQQFFNQLLNG